MGYLNYKRTRSAHVLWFSRLGKTTHASPVDLRHGRSMYGVSQVSHTTIPPREKYFESTNITDAKALTGCPLWMHGHHIWTTVNYIDNPVILGMKYFDNPVKLRLLAANIFKPFFIPHMKNRIIKEVLYDTSQPLENRLLAASIYSPWNLLTIHANLPSLKFGLDLVSQLTELIDGLIVSPLLSLRKNRYLESILNNKSYPIEVRLMAAIAYHPFWFYKRNCYVRDMMDDNSLDMKLRLTAGTMFDCFGPIRYRYNFAEEVMYDPSRPIGVRLMAASMTNCVGYDKLKHKFLRNVMEDAGQSIEIRLIAASIINGIDVDWAVESFLESVVKNESSLYSIENRLTAACFLDRKGSDRIRNSFAKSIMNDSLQPMEYRLLGAALLKRAGIDRQKWEFVQSVMEDPAQPVEMRLLATTVLDKIGIDCVMKRFAKTIMKKSPEGIDKIPTPKISGFGKETQNTDIQDKKATSLFEVIRRMPYHVYLWLVSAAAKVFKTVLKKLKAVGRSVIAITFLLWRIMRTAQKKITKRQALSSIPIIENSKEGNGMLSICSDTLVEAVTNEDHPIRAGPTSDRGFQRSTLSLSLNL